MPYPMKRDTRLGAEHWTGCHSFENIICDGHLDQTSGTRQGGLKMGGTYWYHYQLDGEVDFHNPAEPSTTTCPMLPGQSVNLLNVPMHFSSSNRRHRNASVSSTSSDLRTMDPEDKYVNPRPAPKPALACLNTLAPQSSVPNLGSSHSSNSTAPVRASHGRNASLPSSAVSLRSFRLPRKASMDARGRSASPTPATTGLRAAFRHLAPTKANATEAKISRGRIGYPASHRERLSSEQARRSDHEAADHPQKSNSSAGSEAASRGRSPTPTDLKQAQSETLALRQSVEQFSGIEAAFTVPSFQNHRKQRSRSREPSPLRQPLISSEQPKGEFKIRDANSSQYQPLETLKEVVSAQNTPMWPPSGPIVPVCKLDEADHTSGSSSKRLPTLPHIPSSVFSPGIHTKAPLSGAFKGPEGFTSSLLKVSLSDESPSSIDRSHFSQWTGTTNSSFSSSQWSSVFFDGNSPSLTPKTDPPSQLTSPWGIKSPALSHDIVKPRASFCVFDKDRMPSVISSSTISSCDNTSPSSPLSETFDPTRAPRDEPVSVQKRYGMMLGNFGGYKLPVDGQNSEATLKRHLPYYTDVQHNGDSDHMKIAEQELPHSTTMQQLIQELSYLGDIIQE
jgi:hypothetical protein